LRHIFRALVVPTANQLTDDEATTRMDVARQLELITSGAAAVLPDGELERKLKAVHKGEREPLRVKFGMDPTAPDIHLGHAVILRNCGPSRSWGIRWS
jgi:hypothetical protein